MYIMHMMIRALVYADKKEDAVQQAHSVFEMLTDGQYPFDYYQLFDDSDDWGSAKNRWDESPIAVKHSTKKGKELVSEGWKATLDNMRECFDKSKEYLNKCKDVNAFLKNRSGADMSRYYLRQLGAYNGSAIWLYDNDGSGISDKGHLKDALNKWECLYKDKETKNPYDDLDVWVVPADVHF